MTSIYVQILGHVLFLGGSVLMLYCLWLLWARWSYRQSQKEKNKY